MKKGLAGLVVAVITLFVALAAIEIYLRMQGFGRPPLYDYHPAIGYTLKPSQELKRSRGSTVFINNLGMRCPNAEIDKPPEIFRVLVLGDSVPYGGSYIDQEDVFCSVARRVLNQREKRFEVLNAGVNAYGPQNVLRYIETRGLYGADMVIVYFPWGDLQRDFTNFYIVPFWSDTPRLAVEEFLRHAIWTAFGSLSRRWKNVEAFSSNDDPLVDLNIAALLRIKTHCEERKVPVFFFWSPYLEWLTGKQKSRLDKERAKLMEALPRDRVVSMDTVLESHPHVESLYADPVHYSREGHRIVGEYLAKFISSRLGDASSLPATESK